MVRTIALALFLGCACGPVQVESPELVDGMKDLSAKLADTHNTPLALVDELAAARERIKAVESTNQELETALAHARTELRAPYELELDCDAMPASESEIVTTIDGVHASSVGCPTKSGRIALRDWSPGDSRLHVELHVGNEAAGYNSFAVRLTHGAETIWVVTRGNPMTKSDGCKASPNHRIDCAFDDPFPLEPTHGRVRTIDRERL